MISQKFEPQALAARTIREIVSGITGSPLICLALVEILGRSLPIDRGFFEIKVTLLGITPGLVAIKVTLLGITPGLVKARVI